MIITDDRNLGFAMSLRGIGLYCGEGGGVTATAVAVADRGRTKYQSRAVIVGEGS